MKMARSHKIPRQCIAPKPDKSLQWARARYRSAAGVYESGWRIDDAGHLTVDIVVPFNRSAKVVLPGVQIGEVSINGHPLRDGQQIDDRVELTLGAGRYTIEYLMRENVRHMGMLDNAP